MRYRKIKKVAVTGALLMAACYLSGCSLSFCGFSLGEKEELVFTCGEDAAWQTDEDGTSVGSGPDAVGGGSAGSEPDTDGGATVESGSDAAGGVSVDGRVNINTAGLDELMTLKGVGESRARAIIEYRENYGPFQNKEDIMQIPGIKEGIFSKIEEQIVVQ